MKLFIRPKIDRPQQRVGHGIDHSIRIGRRGKDPAPQADKEDGIWVSFDGAVVDRHPGRYESMETGGDKDIDGSNNGKPVVFTCRYDAAAMRARSRAQSQRQSHYGPVQNMSFGVGTEGQEGVVYSFGDRSDIPTGTNAPASRTRVRGVSEVVPPLDIVEMV
jgi:hypothetical protein